jgi:hypothetical protein
MNGGLFSGRGGRHRVLTVMMVMIMVVIVAG